MSYGDKDTTVHPADLEQVSNCLSRVERKYQPLLDEYYAKKDRVRRAKDTAKLIGIKVVVAFAMIGFISMCALIMGGVHL